VVSGSVSRSGILIWNPESGSRSRKAKMTHKSRKKLRNFKFEVLDVLFLRAEATSVAWKFFMEA
jgi:hypothetical protein